MSATFKVERIELKPNTCAVAMYGSIEQGQIVPGMSLEIPFNNSFSMSCKINTVSSDGLLTILIINAEEQEEAEFLASFNTAGEVLNVVHQ